MESKILNQMKKKLGITLLYNLSKIGLFLGCLTLVIRLAILFFDLPSTIKYGDKKSSTSFNFEDNAMPVMVNLDLKLDTIVSFNSKKTGTSGAFSLEKGSFYDKIRDQVYGKVEEYDLDTTVRNFIFYPHIPIEAGKTSSIEEVEPDSVLNKKVPRFTFKNFGRTEASISIIPSQFIDKFMIALPKLLGLVLFIFIQWLLCKLFLNIYRDIIFERINYKIISKIGYIYFGFFLVTIINFLINNFYIKGIINLNVKHLNPQNWKFENSGNLLSLYFSGNLDFSFLYISLVIFAVAYVFKMGLNLKEDQDLTI